MKKIILFVCLGFIVFQTNAQIGFQLGFNQSISRNKIGSDADFEKEPARNGFKVGVLYEQNFKYGLGLYYALNYSFLTEQTKWKENTNGWLEQQSVTEHYLDAPIHFQYKLMLAKETYLLAYVGPTFSFAVDVQEQLSKKNGLPESNPFYKQETNKYNRFKMDGDTDSFYDYGRFDVKASIGIGFQFRNIQLKGGYDFGLLNQYIDTYNNKESKPWFDYRNEWNIRLVYVLGDWKW